MKSASATRKKHQILNRCEKPEMRSGTDKEVRVDIAGPAEQPNEPVTTTPVKTTHTHMSRSGRGKYCGFVSLSTVIGVAES